MKSLIYTIMVIIFVAALPVTAATLNVPADYPTIQSTIDAAVDGDTVIIAPGTYTGDGNRDIDFLGKAITVCSTDPNDPNIVAATIIDCNGIYKAPHCGFRFDSGEDANSILDGLTITNVYTDHGIIYCYDSNPTIHNCTIVCKTIGIANGNGISCEKSNPTVINCTITGNKYSGIYCRYDSSPAITNCIISDNTSRRGGGINCHYDSNPTIKNCTFNRNSAGSGGGAICSIDSSPVVVDCTFIANSAGRSGGAIYSEAVQDKTITIINCEISGNHGFAGGGIACVRNSRAQIIDCFFSNNSAGFSGGGIFISAKEGMVNNCDIISNTAGSEGGGISIWCADGSVRNTIIMNNTVGSQGKGGGLSHCNVPITNCIISGNSASYGGGLNECQGPVTNCVITGNLARFRAYRQRVFGSGGGMYRCSGPIVNCIIRSNVASVYPQLYDAKNVSYSCVQDYTNGGEGNIDDEPMFVDAGYWDPNGTVGDANDDFWVEGDYHLLPESPCIDAGDPSYVPEPNETDLDGNPRVINGRIDMGAYEYLPPIEVEMKLTPQTLNCKSKGNWVKAHITLPEGILPEDIDVNTPTVLEPFGVESEYIEITGSDDGLVQFETGFDRQNFCEAADEEGLWEIEVWGRLKSGRYFYGQGRLLIIERGR
jgi:parallel beta-helix repeat protein/predicted outer membrane repeat protein